MRCSRRIAALAPAALVVLTAIAPLAIAQPAKLLISQVEVRGGFPSSNLGEYIVVRNPGSSAVDLSNYYVTDATRPAPNNNFYYNLPDESLLIGGGGTDFVARFPAGAMLGAGQEISIAVDGSDGFLAAYGKDPNYELFEDGASPDAVPDMRPARAESVSDTPSLSNAGEVVILFYWDGTTNLVTDIDYLVWGDKEEAVDKTGVTIKKTGNASGSTYLPDTPIANQQGQTAGPTGSGPTGTYIRTNQTEGNQKTSGGNGVGGRDETSENLVATFSNDTQGTPPGVDPIDISPPVLLSASGTEGNSNVDLVFSEALGSGAGTAGNYRVYPTEDEGSEIDVTAAETGGDPSTVTLQLAEALVAGTGYTVEVSNVQDQAGNVIAAGASVTFQTGGSSVFEVTGAFQFGADYVGVGFSQDVNQGAAITPSNFSFTPSLDVSSIAIQENGQTVILKTSSKLPLGTTYSVTVTGVTGPGGASLVGSGSFGFTTSSAQVTNIADIQAMSLPSLNNNETGLPFTIVGQVFIPTTSRGGTPSGYIQDGSGRGINVFGNGSTPAVESLGNVVMISGEVGRYFTTTEIESYTPTLLVGGQPPLVAKVVSVAEANSPQWEGTYIQTSGVLTEKASTGANAWNLNVKAATGSAVVTFRLTGTGLSINPADFAINDNVTGRGAGGAFQTTFQIILGNSDDFFKGGGGPDTTPPSLSSASGEGTAVTVNFSEAVSEGVSTAANYKVFRTTDAGSTVAVTSASGAGSKVTLTLGAALAGGIGYTVEVSNVKDTTGNTITPNSRVTFTAGGEPEDLVITGAFQFGAKHVGIGFSKTLNPGQASASGNYSFSPSLSIESIEVQDNGQTVILHASSELPRSTSYMVTVTGVTAADGKTITGANSADFTTAAEQVVDIATIQADPASYDTKAVTVIGQVYIPTGSRGGTPNGYIQDGSGRGLNLFGTGATAATNTLGTVVKATGTVTLYFTTVEVERYTATQLATGQPNLAAKILTVAQANSPNWEGTYIETTGIISSVAGTGGPPPTGWNINAREETGSGEITFRLTGSGLNIDPANYVAGDKVTGRGAGGAFQSTFQIVLGNNSDFFKETGGGTDETPPRAVSAAFQGKSAQVTFSESVGQGAATASNYKVFETANPSATNRVLAAAASGRTVSLTLEDAVIADVTYSIEVSNVQDLAGNTILTGSVVTGKATEDVATITVPARTFLPRFDREFPVAITGPPGTRGVLRLFDLQGRLVKVLFDNSFTGRADLVWDGRDEEYELVPAGMYIAHFELQGDSRITTDKAPIVVSTRLD